MIDRTPKILPHHLPEREEVGEGEKNGWEDREESTTHCPPINST